MVADLNPFGIHLILAFLGSLVFFYFVGAILISRVEDVLLSIGLRLALGGLLVVSCVAICTAGFGTGMLFYLFLFLWMIWKNKERFSYADLRQTMFVDAGIILVLGVSIFLIEASRSNLLTAAGVYVGNEDVSFYSSFGHVMVQMGVEANPENSSPDINGIIYHFGDLWFSGLYSNALSILPYYAYMIVYRSLMVFIISLMVIGWARQQTGKLWLALLALPLSVTAIYLELFPFPFPNIDLFKTFPCYYPLYGAGPYLVIGLAGLAFTILAAEKNWTAGVVGILFLAFLNGGLIVASAIAGFLIFIGFVLWGFFEKKPLSDSIKEIFPFLFIGALPILYYGLDQRFASSGTDLFSFGYLYLVVHTLIRACVSQIFVLPYLIGLIYFWNRGQQYKKMVLLQASFFGAVLLSLAAIFPLIQGNSGQIPSIHFTGVLAPVCIIGLVSLLFQAERKWLTGIAFAVLVASAYQSARIAVSTEYYRPTYDWESYISGYQKKSTISLKEWSDIRTLQGSRKITRFGYFACDTAASGGVHYNEFTFMKSVLPGAVFHRMNALPKDTTLSKEMQGYYYATSLGYFADKYNFELDKVESAHMEFLKPDYLFLPKGKAKYCVPEKWLMSNEPILESESFLFYGQ